MTFAKLEHLLRFHRQNIFDPDDMKAARHERALRRIIQTKQYAELCRQTREKALHHDSMRLLQMWA